jgi:hypothetical protein
MPFAGCISVCHSGVVRWQTDGECHTFVWVAVALHSGVVCDVMRVNSMTNEEAGSPVVRA